MFICICFHLCATLCIVFVSFFSLVVIHSSDNSSITGCWFFCLFLFICHSLNLHVHTHTDTRLMALFPGLPWWAGTRKVKPIWILLKQETVSGSVISWTICKSAPRSRQIPTPAPNHSVFLQARCPSCRPTNSVKALNLHVQSKLNL